MPSVTLKKESVLLLMHICNYCGSSFKTMAFLYRHQKRAVYCLELQGREVAKHKCACGKEYTLKCNLKRHETTCTGADKNTLEEKVLNAVIDKYGELVRDLRQQISDLAMNNNSINNNRNVVMNNLQPVTDEDLQGHLEHLTLLFIEQGAKGYADYAGHYPLKNKVLCTDRARKKIKYKNAIGEITDDGRTLAKRFFQAISEKNTEILKQAYSDLHSELKDIVADNRAGDANVTDILTKATALQDILLKSQRAARGEDDEFAQEFLTHLSKIL